VDQQGAAGREVWSTGNQIIWMSAENVAVFNTADHDEDVRVVWRQIGLPASCAVRDLWTHIDLGVSRDARKFHLPAHGSALIGVHPRP
jgi:hypothetical protein